MKNTPRWTVIGYVFDGKDDRWGGTVYYFFDSREDAERMYASLEYSCVLRPYHSTDESRIGCGSISEQLRGGS